MNMDPQMQMIVDIALIMIIGGLCAVIFAKLRMPAVIGYLAAGLIVGPFFPLHLVQDVDLINFMANLGIILLMFTLGLDFNLKKLRSIGLTPVLAGIIEVSLMVLTGYGLGTAFGWNGIESLFLGAVMAGSSTAIIVKVMAETGKIKAEHTGTLIGILIVDDFASVFILALTSPIITGAHMTTSSIFLTILLINAFVAISLVLGMAVIPRAMDKLGRDYSDETILLVSLGLCFSLAVTSYVLGLSVAIGAFIMGIIISQSTAAQKVVQKITPIEEMFLAVFFVSIGMLINPVLILDNIWIVLIIAAVFVLGKFATVSLGTYVATQQARTSLTIGLSMVAMGEFSYVIAKMGTEAGVVGPSFYSTVIGASLVTMLVLPLSIRRSDRTISWLSGHLPRWLREDLQYVEGMWASVRHRLSMSQEKRDAVRKELIGILVDVTFLFVVLMAASVVNVFETLLLFLKTWVPLIPYVIFIEIVVALFLPATLNIIKRVRRIADVLTVSAIESGNYSAKAGRLIYRTFMAIISMLLFVIMLSFLSPLLDLFEDVPSGALLLVVVFGAVLVFLLWNVFDTVHNRICHELRKGISGAVEEKPCDPRGGAGN